MLADILAKETHERTLRRHAKACFDYWSKKALVKHEKKMEKVERERKRTEEWNRKQKEAKADGQIIVNGLSKLKRNRMSSALTPTHTSSEVQMQMNGSGGRLVKRKIEVDVPKTAVEIGEEVKKVRYTPSLRLRMVVTQTLSVLLLSRSARRDAAKTLGTWDVYEIYQGSSHFTIGSERIDIDISIFPTDLVCNIFDECVESD